MRVRLPIRAKRRSEALAWVLAGAALLLPVPGLCQGTQGSSAAAQGSSAAGPAAQGARPLGLLTHEQAGAIMPATVFYRGQTATVQLRNSAGIRLAGDRLVLMAVVDTGGYASSVAERYQAYLITEVPLRFGAAVLPPGAYGFGFIAASGLVVMDLGGNQKLTAPTLHDTALARPTPLQIVADPAGGYRLYLGRTYLVFNTLAAAEAPL